MDLEQELKRLRDERQKKFIEEDWEGALKIHDRILELSPSALRFANRGSILFRLGRISEAIASYRKALEMDPDLKRARADLERLEAQQQKEGGAEASSGSTPLSGAVPLGSTTFEAPIDTRMPKKEMLVTEEEGDQSQQEKARQEKINLLRVQRQQAINAENWHEALTLHNQILEFEPTGSRYMNQGSILYRLGKIHEAIAAYRKALELDPSLEKARIDLERLESQVEEEKLLTSPKIAKPTDIQKRIEELRKERQDMIAHEDWEAALRKHDEILALEPSGMRYANKGALLYRINRYKEALECYRKALELDSSLEKIKEDIARLESLLEEENLSNHFAEAEVQEQPAANTAQAAMTPEQIVERINFLKDERQKFLDAKEWDKALELHDEIIRIEPTALRWVNRGSMLYRMQRLEEAIESHRKALELDPNLGRAQIDLERMEKELAQKKLANLKIAPSKGPTAAPAEVLSGENLTAKLEELRQLRQQRIQEGKWEEALQCQDEIVRLEPTGMRYATRGSILYRLGKSDEAILSYRRALDLEPNLEQAKNDLKNLQETEMDRLRQERQKCMEQNDWVNSLRIHDVIMALEPSALRYANRGSILYRMHRLSEAVVAFQKALELDPELQQAKDDLARLQEELAKDPTLQNIPEEFQEDEEDLPLGTVPDEPAKVPQVKSMPMEKKTKLASQVTLTGHTDAITSLQISHDGHWLISSSKDRTIRLWEIGNWNNVQVWQGHNDWIRYLASSQQHIISASDDWTIKIWELATGQSQTLTGHTMPILDIAVAPHQQQFASVSRDRTIRIWDLVQPQCLACLTGHTDWVTSILFSANADRLISASWDQTIRIWEIATASCTHVLEGHTAAISKLYLSKDGSKVISLGEDRSVRIWNAEDGQWLQSLEGHTNAISDLQLADDGNTIVTIGHDSNVIAWNLETGMQKQNWTGYDTRLEKLAITQPLHLIFVADQTQKIQIFSMDSKILSALEEHTHPITALLTLPSHPLLISGDQQGMIKVWDYSSLLG